MFMRSTVVYNLVPRTCGSYQGRNSWGVGVIVVVAKILINFTKILLTNCTLVRKLGKLVRKLVKNSRSENFFCPPPPPPPLANNFGKRNINLRLKSPSGTTSATSLWSGKTSSHIPSRAIPKIVQVYIYCGYDFIIFHSCSIRVHSCSLVFTRVHLCSFVFTCVHSCSDSCGVLDQIGKTAIQGV